MVDEGSERRHNPTLCTLTGVAQRTLKGLDCFRQVTSILCATSIGGLGETFSPLTAITSAWMDAWPLMLRRRSWPRLPNEHCSISEHCMAVARDCKFTIEIEPLPYQRRRRAYLKQSLLHGFRGPSSDVSGVASDQADHARVLARIQRAARQI